MRSFVATLQLNRSSGVGALERRLDERPDGGSLGTHDARKVTECGGGILLALGLFARPASVPLIFTMLVAYATADKEALMTITSDPDQFLSAAPFLFLLASLLVRAFARGRFSLDAALLRKTAVAG